MSERKLPIRKRKFSKGRRIAVSDLLYATLDEQRRRGVNKSRLPSWDSMLRRMLGLPTRAGRPQPLIEGMLETTTGLFILRLNEVAWPELEETAFKLAEKMAKRGRPISPPIRMREVR